MPLEKTHALPDLHERRERVEGHAVFGRHAADAKERVRSFLVRELLGSDPR